MRDQRGIRLTSAGLICCLAVPHLLMVVVIVIIGLNCISKVSPRRSIYLHFEPAWHVGLCALGIAGTG